MSFLSALSPTHLGSGDDVQPRNTEALITATAPALPTGVKLDIVGTDTFVRVRAIGHEVQIRGYEEEPYIQISTSGQVRVNTNSITYLLNQTRFGSDVPSVTTDDITWEIVSTTGEYMWHDHRVHWMSSKPPATMNDEGLIQTWEIPLTIDSADVVVSGELYLRNAASRLWWGIGALVVILMVAFSMFQRRALLWALCGVSAAGVIVGAIEYLGLPQDARITPLMFVFSAVALLLSVLALTANATKRHVFVDPLIAGIGLTLIVLTWQVRDQVTAFYVPGLDAAFIARILVPSIFGAGLVALVDGVRRVVFPEVTPDAHTIN